MHLSLIYLPTTLQNLQFRTIRTNGLADYLPMPLRAYIYSFYQSIETSLSLHEQGGITLFRLHAQRRLHCKEILFFIFFFRFGHNAVYTFQQELFPKHHGTSECCECKERCF